MGLKFRRHALRDAALAAAGLRVAGEVSLVLLQLLDMRCRQTLSCRSRSCQADGAPRPARPRCPYYRGIRACVAPFERSRHHADANELCRRTGVPETDG